MGTLVVISAAPVERFSGLLALLQQNLLRGHYSGHAMLMNICGIDAGGSVWGPMISNAAGPAGPGRAPTPANAVVLQSCMIVLSQRNGSLKAPCGRVARRTRTVRPGLLRA